MFAFFLKSNIHQSRFFCQNLSSALLALILFHYHFHIGNTLFLPMKHFVSAEETKCFRALYCCETHL